MRRVGSSFELPRTRVKLAPIMEVVGLRSSKRHTVPLSSPQNRYDLAAMFCETRAITLVHTHYI